MLRSSKRGLLFGRSVLIAFSGSTVLPAAALADEVSQAPGAGGAGTQLEEIVVTAQHRSERVQDIPLSVATFSASELSRQGVATTTELSQIAPSLVFNNNVNVASPFIRGVGSSQIDPTAESPVATYVDDVYIAVPQSNLFTLAGIEQISVLNGPQGTLFGRNATGGVIQIQTQDPQNTPHLDASLTYGSYNFVSVPVYATVGLSDNVATNLSVLFENQGEGYGRNLYDGHPTFRQAIDNFSFRNKWLIELPTSTTLRFSIDFADLANDNAYQKPKGTFSPINGQTYPGEFNSDADENDYSRTKTGGASLKIDQILDPVTLTSITAYRKTKASYDLDNDDTVLPIAGVVFGEDAHNVSQEIRIRNSDPSPLTWILGGYYYNSTGAYDPFAVDGTAVIPYDSQNTKSIAGFAQASYKLPWDIELTGGLRYTDEKQTYNLPAADLTDSVKNDKLTYRVALDYHFLPDVLGYVSYNTGFKSGGYNLLSPGNVFKPEELASTEVGLKSEFWEHRLRINVDGFTYDYTDQQYFLAGKYSSTVANAPGSRIKGLELNYSILPIEHLAISGGLSLLDGHFTNLPNYVALDSAGVASAPYNAKGNSTVDTPHQVATLSVEYVWNTAHGKVASDIGVQYDSGYYWTPDNRLRQPAYTLLNGSVTWSPETDKYGIKLWVKNALNATYYLSRVDLPGEGDAQMQAPPITGGFTFFYHY